MTTQQPFCFVLPVWGAAYVEYYLKYSLPSQLAIGNLEAVKNPRNVYCIYTRAEDKALIEAAPVFKLLCDLITVRIIVIDEQITNIHRRASECFMQGIEYASTLNAAIIFLVPDALFATGSFKYLQKQLQSGHRAILSACPTFEKVKGSALLQQYFDPQGIINATGRQFIDLVLKALHSNTREQFFEEETGNLMPGVLYWYVGKQGLLSHSFHLHPIMVAPSNWQHQFSGTVDGDYVHGACPNPEEVLIVQDTDDFCMMEIADARHIIDACYTKGKADDVIEWAIIHANPQHLEAVKTPIYLRTSNFTQHDSEWLAVENRAAKVVGHVQQYFATGFSVAKLLKFRYALLRRFLFKLRLAAQQPKQSNTNFIVKSIVWAHAKYVSLASIFNKTQTKILAALFSKNTKWTLTWFNIYYWPIKLFPDQLIEAVFGTEHELAYTEDQSLNVFNSWFQTTRFNKVSADFLEAKQEAITLNAFQAPKNFVRCISIFVAVFARWRLRHKSPMLVQMISLPFILPLQIIFVLIFNVFIGLYLLLTSRANDVNFQFYLI